MPYPCPTFPHTLLIPERRLEIGQRLGQIGEELNQLSLQTLPAERLVNRILTLQQERAALVARLAES